MIIFDKWLSWVRFQTETNLSNKSTLGVSERKMRDQPETDKNLQILS